MGFGFGVWSFEIGVLRVHGVRFRGLGVREQGLGFIQGSGSRG